MEFGKYLKEVRLQKGLTMGKVVERSGRGINKTTISRIEAGQRSLSLKVAHCLSKVYDISLDDLAEIAVGNKTIPLKTHFDVSPEEKKLVLNYRKLPSALKVPIKSIINDACLHYHQNEKQSQQRQQAPRQAS